MTHWVRLLRSFQSLAMTFIVRNIDPRVFCTFIPHDKYIGKIVLLRVD
jgi:hypothetical protein